ncbi:MAG TPA: M1 family metallopeptidase, partial [Bacteroidia bacterium]|nr:M1 family metallopeptidase [Bacteroidia bacterium]
MRLKICHLLILSGLYFNAPAFSQHHNLHPHRALSASIHDTLGLRSDTIDILNYTINFDYVKFTDSTIGGNTVIHFTPKMNNINTITLDLLGFTIDSVEMSNTLLTYSYNDTAIIAKLPSTENIGDTSDITVYYHGVPHIENSGAVGGFFFEPPYAFNMGEAVNDQPHTYGRAWYPCFDNFRERATYTFNITTTGGNIAYCNGYLAKDTTIGANRTRTWRMAHTLPPYLASIDIAPYTQINDTYYGTDTIPIVIAAEAKDTTMIKSSFIHLKNTISIYQNCFGKYPWNKVGYSMVGANGGSMEHATNIALPISWVDGSLGSETVMVHELSHHWFGDMVTCRTANDMWLNEGFATYNEFIFEEYMYGEPSYQYWHRSNHEYVLHYAHNYDNGYRALSPMSSPYTFSTTTYDKGGDVVGTLRAYMGDSAFFKGLKYYLSTHAYQPVTTDTLKRSMEKSSGMNLTDFFNDWVYAPGFPHFSIDSMTATPSGLNYSVTIYVKQKFTGAPGYYNNVPLQVTLKS